MQPPTLAAGIGIRGAQRSIFEILACTAEAVGSSASSSSSERVTSVMTFVDWVKWLVGFLRCEMRDSFFELCASFSIFMHATRSLFPILHLFAWVLFK